MPNNIRAEVVERFTRIAHAPQQEEKFPVGPASAKTLGYDADVIDQLPPSVTESFTGVGNPLALRKLMTGEAVLDVGCGAGLDSILAARAVGPSGKVIGVDMIKAMVDKAKTNAKMAGVAKCGVHPSQHRGLAAGPRKHGHRNFQRRAEPMPPP